MPTIVFWNVAKTASAAMIADLAKETDADVLICAESHHETTAIVRELNRRSEQTYYPDPIHNARLSTFLRFEPEPAHAVSDDSGISIRHVQFRLSASALVVGVHLPSKLWKTDADQWAIANRLSHAIARAEAQVGHRRTIVIGDLNMDPFEPGVVGAGGLHAVVDSEVARRGSRSVGGARQEFFFNPMWSVSGGLSRRTHGTYYYDSGTETNYYWHTFDQILLRPTLLPAAGARSARVVERIAGKSLLDARGRPDKARASDHLPIVCQLEPIEVTNDA